MDLLHDRLRAELKARGLSHAEAARVAGLSDSQGLRDVIAGRKRLTAEMLAALAATGIDVLYVLTGQRAGGAAAAPPAPALTPEQRALLDNYAACAPEDRAAVRRFAAAAAQPLSAPVRKGTKR